MAETKNLTHEDAEQIGKQLFARAGVGGDPGAWLTVIAEFGKTVVPELTLTDVEYTALVGVLLYKDMIPKVTGEDNATNRRLALIDRLNREQGYNSLCADVEDIMKDYRERQDVLYTIHTYFDYLDKVLPAIQPVELPACIVLQALDRAWLNGADTIAAHEDALQAAYKAAKYPERTFPSDRAAFLGDLKALYDRSGVQTRVSRNAETLLRKYELILLNTKGPVIYA